MIVRRLLIVFSIGSLVAGCASSPPPTGGRIAWDGLGQDPNSHIRQKLRFTESSPAVPDQNAEREKVLATLSPDSAEWKVLHNQIEAEYDRRLKKTLVICKGCFQKDQTDYTGSVRLEAGKE
jgi:hypothetical protein